jgi:hypothetical protein
MMIDRDDKSPRCDCGARDGSNTHDAHCELVQEDFVEESRALTSTGTDRGRRASQAGEVPSQ